MLRALFLILALAHLAQSQVLGGSWQNANQGFFQATVSAAYGLRSFPWNFCHSHCQFSGSYYFMRSWEDYDVNFVEETAIFDWSYDFPPSTWSDNCDSVIDQLRSSSILGTPSRARGEECKPEWIYIEQVVIDYKMDSGVFEWKHRISEAYRPAEDAWNLWVSYALGSKGSPEAYDRFDGLLRYFPESGTSALTGEFKDAFYYVESYIASYERNFCSMQMSHEVVDGKLWCQGNLNDLDTDNIDYPTAEYCDHMNVWNDYYLGYEFGSDSCPGVDSECDSVFFFYRGDNVVREAKEPRLTKTQRLLRATRNPEQLSQVEKRDLPSTTSLFSTQGEVGGVRFPYCAQK